MGGVGGGGGGGEGGIVRNGPLFQRCQVYD